MEQLTRRRIAFAVILVLVIAASIFYFLWGTIINRGKLILVGEAPFEVNIYEAGKYICDKSPCEIRQKRGIKNLIMSKEGNEVLVAEVDVPLWGEVTKAIKFKVTPYMREVEEIPVEEGVKEFELTFDNTNKLYKLSEKNSIIDEAIVYFQKEIKSPVIYGNERSIIIIDGEKNQAYRVDQPTNSREKIEGDFEGITKGFWSEDGESFVFETEEGENISLLNKDNKIKELDIIKGRTIYEWAYDGALFFVTDQAFAPSTNVGEYSDYISVVEEVTTTFSFGIYHPDEDSYTQIKNSELVSLPSVLIPASNGKIIYVESEDKNYALYFE